MTSIQGYRRCDWNPPLWSLVVVSTLLVLGGGAQSTAMVVAERAVCAVEPKSEASIGSQVGASSENFNLDIDMISIKAMRAQQVNYYFDYGNENSSNPRYIGSGTDSLGINGVVSRDQFERLFNGFHPLTGQALVQNAGRNTGKRKRQPGWDMVFSPPKDVSLLWAFGDIHQRSAVLKAHHMAMSAAIEHVIESVIESRVGKGGKKAVRGKMIAVAFDHFTSRNHDPLLHTHFLVQNLAVRPDGSTGSISSRMLYVIRKLADVYYRDTLAEELEKRLGVRIVLRRHGFEILGIEADVRDAFSTRRKEIERLLEARWIDGLVSQSAAAAMATRRRKEHVPLQKLWLIWNEKLKALWTSPERIQDRVRKIAAVNRGLQLNARRNDPRSDHEWAVAEAEAKVAKLRHAFASEANVKPKPTDGTMAAIGVSDVSANEGRTPSNATDIRPRDATPQANTLVIKDRITIAEHLAVPSNESKLQPIVDLSSSKPKQTSPSLAVDRQAGSQSVSEPLENRKVSRPNGIFHTPQANIEQKPSQQSSRNSEDSGSHHQSKAAKAREADIRKTARLWKRVRKLADSAVARYAIRRTAKLMAQFTRADVMRMSATSLPLRLYGIRRLERQIESQFAKTKGLVRLENAVFGQTVYTTQKTLNVETKLRDLVKRGEKSKWHACMPVLVKAGLAFARHLHPDEKEAVRDLTEGRGAIRVFSAKEGTRRQEILRAAARIWKNCGYLNVTFIAPNATEARHLELTTGMPAQSFAAAVQDFWCGKLKLHPWSVVIVDRAEFLAPKDLLWLTKKARSRGAKLVLAGNDAGLLAFHKAETFERLAAIAPQTKLSTVVRPARKSVGSILEMLRLKKPKPIPPSGTSLTVSNDEVDAMRELAIAWAKMTNAEQRGAAVICSSRSEQKLLNQAIQSELRARGQIGKKSVDVNGQQISTGDRVRFGRTSRQLGFAVGETGTVVGLIRFASNAFVKMDDGRFKVVPLLRYSQIEPAYAATERQVADRLFDHALVYCGRSMSREKARMHRAKAPGNTKYFISKELEQLLTFRRRRSERSGPDCRPRVEPQCALLKEQKRCL